MKGVLSKEEALQLAKDWRNEADPVADAWSYADVMAAVIEQWASHVPDTVIVDTRSFEELRIENQAAGGCGCAPGTILCPH